MREPNILLDAIIEEAGMSHGGLAARINRLGDRGGLGLLYDHASVRRWIRDGTIPRGRAPHLTGKQPLINHTHPERAGVARCPCSLPHDRSAARRWPLRRRRCSAVAVQERGDG